MFTRVFKRDSAPKIAEGKEIRVRVRVQAGARAHPRARGASLDINAFFCCLRRVNELINWIKTDAIRTSAQIIWRRKSLFLRNVISALKSANYHSLPKAHRFTSIES